MPGPTNTELIRDLQARATTLEERVRSLDREGIRLDAAHTKTAETLKQAEMRLEARLTVLERKFEELNGKFEDGKKTLEEQERKRWTLLVAVTGTCVACILTLFANIVLVFLRK
jgi:hypothetical protein